MWLSSRRTRWWTCFARSCDSPAQRRAAVSAIAARVRCSSTAYRSTRVLCLPRTWVARRSPRSKGSRTMAGSRRFSGRWWAREAFSAATARRVWCSPRRRCWIEIQNPPPTKSKTLWLATSADARGTQAFSARSSGARTTAPAGCVRRKRTPFPPTRTQAPTIAPARAIARQSACPCRASTLPTR